MNRPYDMLRRHDCVFPRIRVYSQVRPSPVHAARGIPLGRRNGPEIAAHNTLMNHGFEIHRRRSIRLPGHDYSQVGVDFVTICTQDRNCALGTVEEGKVILNDLGQIVNRQWLEIAGDGVGIELDHYVIMPNHVHGIVIFSRPVGAIHESPLRMTMYERRTMGLSKIIGRFKMTSAKIINAIRKMPGVRVWQRNYYEHIIRNEADYERIVEYIRDNPCRWEEDDLHPNPHIAPIK